MTETYEKLVGEGRQGDFVHQNQAMAAKDGFKNVSALWLRKTLSYEQGLESIEEGRAQTEDILATVREMKPAVSEAGKFVLKHKDGRAFRPTEHALGQLGSWAGTGSWFLKKLTLDPDPEGGTPGFEPDRGDSETAARAVANGFRRIDGDKTFLFRVRQDGTLRAMLSDSYRPIDNRWFVEALAKLVPGGRLSHWKGDSDTLWGNVLIPDTIREESDSDYGGLLAVGNSEIGERKMTSLPSLFRAICQNGCIWDRKDGKAIVRVHRGDFQLAEIFKALEENLKEQIPLVVGGIDRLLATRSLAVPAGDSMLPVFAELAGEFRLSKTQAGGLLDGYNRERAVAGDTARSLFGVVAAVTRAGQEFDNPTWFRFDQIGGQLAAFTEDRWSSFLTRARSLSAKSVEAAFALAA
jgi:hypothetical protein